MYHCEYARSLDESESHSRFMAVNLRSWSAERGTRLLWKMDHIKVPFTVQYKLCFTKTDWSRLLHTCVLWYSLFNSSLLYFFCRSLPETNWGLNFSCDIYILRFDKPVQRPTWGLLARCSPISHPVNVCLSNPGSCLGTELSCSSHLII
jgi:hypothetical protein